MVGKDIVVTPANIELIIVIQTTVVKTIAVVPLPGSTSCSVTATSIGCRSSAAGEKPLLVVCTLGGCLTVAAIGVCG